MRESDPEDEGDIAKDTARRLRQTRLAMFYEDQDEFAEDAELEQSRYSRFEGGGRRISLEAAMLLVKHHGLSLDWIYYGDSNAIDGRLWNRIRILRKRDLWRGDDDKGAIQVLLKASPDAEDEFARVGPKSGKRKI